MGQSKRNRMPPEARKRLQVARDVARLDMAIGLAGIFRPLRDGATRKEIALKQVWNGGTVTLRGIELSERDLAVLLGLLVIALRDGDPDITPGKEIAQLGAKGAAADSDVITIRTSMAVLCEVIGRDPRSHGTRVDIRTSIERLSMIVVRGEAGERWAMSHLIAGAAGRGRDAIGVTLSLRLTRAVLGAGSYAQISMCDYRSLPPGVARLVYTWLRTWMCGARERTIGLRALMRHIYGADAISARTARHRLQQVRGAIATLETIGWSTTIEGESATVIAPRREPESDESGPALPRKRPSVAAQDPANG